MNTLAGTGALIRLAVRRDRLILTLWTVVLALLPLLYASATAELYPTDEGLRSYYNSLVANPSMLSSIGPVFGPSLGALTAWRAGILIVFIALASLLTVIRHTRADEDAGRRELLGATVVGRHAPLAAALAVTWIGCLLLGALMIATLVGFGLPATGSLAIGLSYAAAGLVFAAVGGVAAQLTEGAGAARGVALAGLGTAYVLRAAGDSGGPDGKLAWLSWLSPIGWVQQVRPYAGERWWLFGLLGALLLVLTVAGWVLLARRDVGAGVLPARLGPARAGTALRSPLGLAWRLHRGALFGWTVAMAVLGAVVGGASGSVDQLVVDSPQMASMFARLGGVASLKDTYLSVSVGMMALVTAGYAIQTALRMRTEETDGRAEPVLATATSRTAWVLSHVVFTVLGPAVALAALGATMGVVSADGDPGRQVSRLLVAALVQLPAVWILSGIAIAMFGLLPRLAAATAWAVLAFCGFVSFFGQLLRFDQRLLDTSPFSHIPKLPTEEFAAVPVLVLTAVAVVLAAVGVAGFRRRDLTPG